MRVRGWSGTVFPRKKKAGQVDSAPEQEEGAVAEEGQDVAEEGAEVPIPLLLQPGREALLEIGHRDRGVRGHPRAAPELHRAQPRARVAPAPRAGRARVGAG